MSPSGVAVVTGGVGALGRRIGQRLGEAGHPLLLVDLAPEVEEVAAELGARACRADLTTEDGVAAVLAATDGDVGVLVNSAGILRDARVGRMDAGMFSAVIAVNLLAAMRLTLALEDRFAEGASIVNMSSRAGLGNFGQTNYAASKAGLVGFTRALAQRWAPRVRVNAIAPSLVDSPMTHSIPEDVLTKLVKTIPMGRIGTPDDVASAAVWLSSEQASMITGQCLLLCGGRSVSP